MQPTCYARSGGLTERDGPWDGIGGKKREKERGGGPTGRPTLVTKWRFLAAVKDTISWSGGELKVPCKIGRRKWEAGCTPTVLDPTLMFLERQRVGELMPEIYILTLPMDRSKGRSIGTESYSDDRF